MKEVNGSELKPPSPVTQVDVVDISNHRNDVDLQSTLPVSAILASSIVSERSPNLLAESSNSLPNAGTSQGVDTGTDGENFLKPKSQKILIQLRPMQAQDLNKIFGLYLKSNDEEAKSNPLERLQREEMWEIRRTFRQFRVELMSKSLFFGFVVEYGEELIGYISGLIKNLSPILALRRYGSVTEFFVPEVLRGTEVESRLLSMLLDTFLRRDIRYVDMEIVASNEQQENLFSSFGFAIVTKSMGRFL